MEGREGRIRKIGNEGRESSAEREISSPKIRSFEGVWGQIKGEGESTGGEFTRRIANR